MNFTPNIQKRVMRWLKQTLVVIFALCGTLGIYSLNTIYRANFHPVVEGQAYRAGQMDTNQLARTIECYGIKSIVNLRGKHPAENWYQAEIETSRKLKVVHYSCPINSGDDLTIEQMNDLVVLLHEVPKPVLIHCSGGADRAGLVSALFRLVITSEEPEQAADELSIWYGHVPLIRPKVKAMERSFWRYVSNHISYPNSDLSELASAIMLVTNKTPAPTSTEIESHRIRHEAGPCPCHELQRHDAPFEPQRK